MIGWWIGLGIAAAAPCQLEAPATAALEEPLPEADVTVVLELWVDEAETAWVTAMLQVLEERGLPGTLVSRAPFDDAARTRLDGVADRGHEVVLRLDEPPRTVQTDEGIVSPDLRMLRKTSRLFRRLSGERVRAAVVPIPSRATEAILVQAGYRALLPEPSLATPSPRLAAHFEGQLQLGVVIPGGPYRGPCGSTHLVAPFTPRAADRATLALRQTSGSSGVVRVGIDGSSGRADDALVLARWLDEVVLPAGGVVSTPAALRDARVDLLRQVPERSVAEEARTGGRLVALRDLTAAAEALREAPVVPRSLPGGLVPTEAFVGFALKVVGEVEEGDVVRLRALAGPRTGARTTLSGPVTIDRDALVATTRALLAALPERLPASMPVDGRLLTASELLLALASAARGDEVVRTRPVAVPDPNEEGLGWGRSTFP